MKCPGHRRRGHQPGVLLLIFKIMHEFSTNDARLKSQKLIYAAFYGTLQLAATTSLLYVSKILIGRKLQPPHACNNARQYFSVSLNIVPSATKRQHTFSFITISQKKTQVETSAYRQNWQPKHHDMPSTSASSIQCKHEHQ